MKKLLSILGSVTLIGSSTPALASCAGNHHSNSPPEPDTIDQVINDVIKKVRGEFLIGGQNQYLNAGDIKDGDSILQLLDQNYGKKQEILLTDQKITTAFNTVVQNVLRAISQNLLKDSIFKSYFTSIPVDKILVFNPAKTVYKQEPLLWKPGGDETFGIPKDQYQKILQDSNITSLDKIWTNVSFSLNIKDLRTGKIIQHTSDTNTNFLLANQGADIANLISESGKKIAGELKKTNIVARLNNFSADDVQQFAQFKTLAKSSLEDYLNKKFPSSKIQINEFESNSNQTNDFASWGINGSQQSFLDKYESGNVLTFQPKFSTEEMKKNLVADYKKSDQEFSSALDKQIDSWEKDGWTFTDPTNPIPNRPNIFNYGAITLSNWTIDGLNLAPISVPYFITHDGTLNRLDTYVDQVTPVIANIFSTSSTLFNQERGNNEILTLRNFNSIIKCNIFAVIYKNQDVLNHYSGVPFTDTFDLLTFDAIDLAKKDSTVTQEALNNIIGFKTNNNQQYSFCGDSMTNFLNYFLYGYQLLKTLDKDDFKNWPDLTGAFANYLHPAATPYFEILGTKISFWNTSEASFSFIAGADSTKS